MQEGNVSTAQLLAAGYSRDAVRHGVRVRRLIRRHHGVYAVGYVRDDFMSRVWAAYLACGDEACLAGPSAAAVYRASPEHFGAIHVARATRGPQRPRIVLRRTVLPPEDRCTHRTLPLTSPPRTLLDLAGMQRESTVTRAYNEFQVLRLLTPEDLRASLRRWEGRRGAGLLRRIVDGGAGATRSVLEDQFLPLITRAALPRPSLTPQSSD